MHVIPLTESRSVHLLVILNNGMRMFLRLISMDRLPYRPGFGSGGNRAPVGVEIVHIRNPPSPDIIRCSVILFFTMIVSILITPTVIAMNIYLSNPSVGCQCNV